MAIAKPAHRRLGVGRLIMVRAARQTACRNHRYCAEWFGTCF
jgi:hypothetical protein